MPIKAAGFRWSDMPENISPSVAVERAFAILEATAGQSGGLTNAEISRRLGIPKSSASYILRTLERRGYLRREEESGRYRLGLKLLNLGRGVLSGYGLREIAITAMRVLVDRTGLTAHLAVLDRGEAVYIEKVEAPGFIKMDTWVGRRMFVHSTSVGKALVANLPKQAVDAILREHGMVKRTPKTITTPRRYHAELALVREKGFAVDDEENSLDARCLAVPVFDANGGVVAAIGLSGTVSHLDPGSIPRVAELAREASRRITRQLGAPSLSN
jgi:DNA-binding IclR family transcriptional regulator